MNERLTRTDMRYLALLLVATVFAVVAIWLTQQDLNGDNAKCREQFGSDWHYSRSYGANCINGTTGEGRFFKDDKR